MSHHREEYRVEGMAEPLSHYTDAVKAGGLLFVSGIVPLDADGRLVGEGDVADQARQVFRNMVKVVHYLLDVDHRPQINPVRMEFFGDARPASTLVEVSALAVPGALLEIEAVAAIPD
jgi:2-iminobutanoate/2-iminopropanoate deaminase